MNEKHPKNASVFGDLREFRKFFAEQKTEIIIFETQRL